MTLPLTLRHRSPLDGVPAEVFADLGAFVRRVAPRWLDGCRSHGRLSMRRARQRERTRGLRRGYRLVNPLDRALVARPIRRPGRR